MTSQMADKITATATSTEAVSAFLSRVSEIEPELQSFRQINEEQMFLEAAALDALPISQHGPLHGQLVAVKEVFDVAGYDCGWGTPIHSDRRPEADCLAVQRLRSAGAIIAGMTVSTEYAMSAVGPTVNPHDTKRSPGASSQGSAAAVGAGLVNLALGSQTIGSIIRPASYCGCIGMKPTWNAIDPQGCMPLSAPLDHVGILANNPDGAATMLMVLAPGLSPAQAQTNTVTILEPWYEALTSPEALFAVDDAAATLAQQGMNIRTVRMPDEIAALEVETLDTLLAYGMAQNHGADFDTHSDRMTDRIKDYIQRGQRTTSAAYEKALATQDLIIRDLQDLLQGSVAIMPSATGVAPLSAEGTGERDPQRLWTLAGFPALSVPSARANGLPLGIQVIASPGRDLDTLDMARRLLG